MRLIAVILVLSALVGGLALTTAQRDERSQSESVLASTVDSMQVYRNAVTEFAAANPTVTAEVDKADLNLPTWFTPPAAVRNFVDAGDAYVFVVAETAGAATKLFEDTSASALVGTARNGLLFSSVDGLTAIALPSIIPEDAVVYVAPKAATVATPCPPAPTVSESQPGTCPAGEHGAFTQTREATWDSVPAPTCWVASGWTAWSPAIPPTGTCTPCPAPETETQTGSCPTGQFGATTQQRTRSFDCGAGSWNAWSAWATTSNSCAPCPVPQTETQSIACPAGQTGAHTQQRSRSFDCGAGTWGAWGAWATTSNTCANCPTAETETRNVPCPNGEFGTTTQQRSRSFDCGAGTWGAWGAWATTGACTLCPPNTFEAETQWVATNANCTAGQFGTITWERQQARNRSVTYHCSTGTTSTPPPTFGTWGAWSDTGATRNNVNTCSVCPGPTTLSDQHWDPRNPGCGSGSSGTHTFEMRQSRTRSVTHNCPAGTTVLPAPILGPWTVWSDDGVTRNTVNTCEPNCTLPSPATETDSRWVATTGICPAGHWGSTSSERQQSRSRTAYCPAATGPFAWGSWTAWTDTGATRNNVNTCPPCPGPFNETQGNWVPRSQPCPTGLTGTHTWEEWAIRVRNVTYYCPAGTTSPPSARYGAWSGWIDSGDIRNEVNTCAAPSMCPPGRTHVGSFREFFEHSGAQESSCSGNSGWGRRPDPRFAPDQNCAGSEGMIDWNWGYRCVSDDVLALVAAECVARCI